MTDEITVLDPNGKSLIESLWRGLIADDVTRWLSKNESFEDAELIEYIRTGEKE